MSYSRSAEMGSMELGAAQRKCDSLLFSEALLPLEDSSGVGAKGKGALGCHITVIDTITALKGKLRLWIYTDPDGVVVQRRFFDRSSILAAWRQNGALTDYSTTPSDFTIFGEHGAASSLPI